MTFLFGLFFHLLLLWWSWETSSDPGLLIFNENAAKWISELCQTLYEG